MKRLGTISIFIENKESVNKVNEILSQYGDLMISRMGIPYREKQISVIVLIVDASNEEMGALSGLVGNLKGVSVKTAVKKS
jgi:putative iron-only hydrogenase system regulator